jgi:hypothetical protein
VAAEALMSKPSNANRTTGLILASVALVLFIGVIVRKVLFG